MRLAALLAIPAIIWLAFILGTAFIEFCWSRRNKWWAGLPLWMAGGFTGIGVVIAAVILLIDWAFQVKVR